MVSIYAVKEHRWDYDFHDKLIAIFSAKEDAVNYINNFQSYDESREEGYVIEQWTINEPNSSVLAHKKVSG